ncbi:MAG: lytic transglycosylase domain-containing protein [Acidiferrobacterales bacterium]
MLQINLKKNLFTLLLAAIFSVMSAAASAGLYIYQLPNGSRIITDHLLNNKHYKLVRSGNTDSRLGTLLASNNHQFFRTDTSAYDHFIRNSASEHRVDHALVKAIIHAESAFNPYATSKKGARGLMQLLPTTAAMYGVSNLYDPEQNIDAGVQHLKYLLKKYSNNSRLAVAAYNAGETAVRRYGGVPPYKETRTYVTKVLRYKSRYKIL